MGTPTQDPNSGSANNEDPSHDIVVERYRFLLQQIHTTNENAYRFVGIFQAVATALVTAALAVFVGYSGWNIAPDVARVAIRGLLVMVSLVAIFTIMLIVVGAIAWVDYRKEESNLANRYCGTDFRSSPSVGNLWRWYETYLILFVVTVTVALWILAETCVLPNIHA